MVGHLVFSSAKKTPTKTPLCDISGDIKCHSSSSSLGAVAQRRVKDLGAVQRMKSRHFMKMGVKNNSFQFHFREDAPY